MTRLLALCLVCLLQALFPTQTLAEDSATLALSKHPQWLHLLHYHQVGIFSRWESQADDPDFFLSASGKQDPNAELLATIQAFSADPTTSQTMQCRFPARFAWLKEQLGKQRFTDYACPDYEQWAKKIDADGLSMIFPAAYLNSPSSMFGHTLLRIDSKHRKNALLDFSVNYAANADPNDNELLFSLKGLSGGYPGVFSILPYYQKVKEYSYLEARDVWEYQLDITPDELAQFLRHTWEVKDTHFDYYFFTENCSYHLLTLLDAASERFNFSDQFYSDVIPADTVRVLNQQGIIRQANFRPSTQTLMSNMTQQLSATQQHLAKTLAESSLDIAGVLRNESPTASARILDLAYQYSRYLAVRKKQHSQKLAKRSIALLSARSKIDIQQAFTAHKAPGTRDDEGHRSHRIQSSFGREFDQNFIEFGLRMAYHDWLDTAAGYVQGAQLEIINAKVRHYLNDPKRLQLEEFRAIDIASMSPRTRFVTPSSWFVSTGLYRPKAEPDELMPYLNGGAGLTYLLAAQRISLLVKSELNLDNDIDKGYRFALGPRLTWLTQHDTWSASLEWSRLYDLAGAEFNLNRVDLGFSKALNKDWQWRIEAQYNEYQQHRRANKSFDLGSTASLMYYF